jgi:hypothetical protein
MSPSFTVASHFAKCSKSVRATYDALLTASHAFGPVREDPKKTSIHLLRSTAFAGVATRKDSLVLTLKADTHVKHPRIHRVQQTSANRWHLEVRLAAPEEVDAQIQAWLAHAYALAWTDTPTSRLE